MRELSLQRELMMMIYETNYNLFFKENIINEMFIYLNFIFNLKLIFFIIK